jgi:hypothetical protein
MNYFGRFLINLSLKNAICKRKKKIVGLYISKHCNLVNGKVESNCPPVDARAI